MEEFVQGMIEEDKPFPDRPSESPVTEAFAEAPVVTEQPVAEAPAPVKPAKKSREQAPAPKKDIDKADIPPYSDLNKPKPKLSPEEQQIVDALHGGERLVDDVIAETGLTTGKLLASLTMLELKGIIRRLPGKRIAIK